MSRQASDGSSAEWVTGKTCRILLEGEDLHTVHVKETRDKGWDLRQKWKCEE